MIYFYFVPKSRLKWPKFDLDFLGVSIPSPGSSKMGQSLIRLFIQYQFHTKNEHSKNSIILR